MRAEITKGEWLQQVQWLKDVTKYSTIIYDTEVELPSHADDTLTSRRSINPTYKAYMERTFRWHCGSCISDDGEAFWCDEDNPSCCVHNKPPEALSNNKGSGEVKEPMPSPKGEQ